MTWSIDAVHLQLMLDRCLLPLNRHPVRGEPRVVYESDLWRQLYFPRAGEIIVADQSDPKQASKGEEG